VPGRRKPSGKSYGHFTVAVVVLGVHVLICYLDESGDTCPLASSSPPSHITPLIVIAGLLIDQQKLLAVTHEFLDLKSRFYPGLMPRHPHHLSRVLVEIKGADIRKAARSHDKQEQRSAIGFLENVVSLLERHQIKLLSRVWVKAIGARCNGKAVYTYSTQSICAGTQHLLARMNDNGIVIADSRSPALNANVAHSIFTQKFKAEGDEYNRLYEMPTFGHSENHVGLQLCDLVASALLFPIAAHTYCAGHVTSVHVQPKHKSLKQRFAARVCRLQYRYQDPVSGKWLGGVVVSDELTKRSGAEMFRTPTSVPVASGTLTAVPSVAALPAVVPPAPIVVTSTASTSHTAPAGVVVVPPLSSESESS
jgi:hypothetical protein